MCWEWRLGEKEDPAFLPGDGEKKTFILDWVAKGSGYFYKKRREGETAGLAVPGRGEKEGGCHPVTPDRKDGAPKREAAFRTDLHRGKPPASGGAGRAGFFFLTERGKGGGRD